MHRTILSSMLVAVILVSILASAAAMAAPVVKRVPLTADVVAKSPKWTEMAKAIGLPFPDLFVDKDGAATGTEGNLPTPSVCRMYGGAWGLDGSGLKLRFNSEGGGFELWHQADCPGVTGNTPNGIVVHAELGENGEHFLCVGTTTGAGTTTTQASGLAAQLNAALANPTGTDWAAFNNAVAKTDTGVKVDLLLAKLKVHYNAETGELDKGVAKADKPAADKEKAGEKPAKGKKTAPLWLIAVLGLCILLGGIFTQKTLVGKLTFIAIGVALIAPAILHFAFGIMF